MKPKLANNKKKILIVVLLTLMTFLITYAVSFIIVLCVIGAMLTIAGGIPLEQGIFLAFGSSEMRDLANQASLIIAIVPSIIVAIIVFAKAENQSDTTIKPISYSPYSTKHKKTKNGNRGYVPDEKQLDEIEYQEVLAIMPYKSKSILTRPEESLWKILQQKLPKDVVLLTKPCLKEFINVVDYESGPVNKRAWREIAQKHVDFLICDKNMYPLYAVEYDGDTHEKNNPANTATIKSDDFKNRLFSHVNLPLFRIKYAEESVLQTKVDELLQQYQNCYSEPNMINSIENLKMAYEVYNAINTAKNCSQQQNK